ncbi:MAG: GGDEF domain-containing protein [Alphaproteobacteria bacterium]|nr:GGDEF domain-containing protein [Alphaproteobacteria bacterium]
MVIGGDMHMAGLWSRRAMERLAHDELPPSPDNYAVYYHCAAGDMPALTAAFDDISAKGRITQEQCTELYNKYFAFDAEAAFLKDANGIIDKELKRVMEMLGATVEGTSRFGEKLDSFTGSLSGADGLDTLRQAVEKIAEETHLVAAHNRKLQGELETTTAQLSEMRDDFNRVHRESQIDPLTEVGNRKFFDREIAHAIAEAHDKDGLLSLLMVDIDHFKNFNDSHGHLIGDQVLRLVARTLVENLKGRDIIARYGGEEFVILLPQTRVQDAERVANQLRAGLATKQIKRRGSNEVLGVITISIGAAEYVMDEAVESLIARADTALYKAKQTGRNKVVCAE